MNKRFWISVLVIFVLSMAIGFLVHGVLLSEDYLQLTGMFRSQEDSEKYFPLMLLAHVFFAIGFVWVYTKGKEQKPFLAQGIRFGIAIAILMTISTYMIYYAVQPMPGDLVIRQIIFDTIGVIILGVVVARLNK